MLINNLVASIGFKYGDRIIVVEDVAFKLEPVHEVCDDRDLISDDFVQGLVLQGGADLHEYTFFLYGG